MITATHLPERTYHTISTTDTSTDDGIDLIAVERAVNNRQPLPHLTTAEKRHAVALLSHLDLTITEIARRTGTTTGTVSHWINPDKPRGRREPQPCPSRAAYRRHLAAGENCEACKAANSAADARYRRIR